MHKPDRHSLPFQATQQDEAILTNKNKHWPQVLKLLIHSAGRNVFITDNHMYVGRLRPPQARACCEVYRWRVSLKELPHNGSYILWCRVPFSTGVTPAPPHRYEGLVITIYSVLKSVSCLGLLAVHRMNTVNYVFTQHRD